MAARRAAITRKTRRSSPEGRARTKQSRPSEQDLLGDRGHVRAGLGEDVADGEAAAGEVAVTGEVVHVPLVGHRGAVEPDGVVEAVAHEAVALDLLVGGGALGVKGDRKSTRLNSSH